MSEFKPQGSANMAWALATVKYRNEKLFSALVSTAEQRLIDFTS